MSGDVCHCINCCILILVLSFWIDIWSPHIIWSIRCGVEYGLNPISHPILPIPSSLSSPRSLPLPLICTSKAYDVVARQNPVLV